MLDNIIVALVLIVISLIVFTIILAFIAWFLLTLNDFLSLFDRPYRNQNAMNHNMWGTRTKTTKHQSLNPKLW